MEQPVRRLSLKQQAIAEADDILRKAECRYDGRPKSEASSGDLMSSYRVIRTPMGGAVKPYGKPLRRC